MSRKLMTLSLTATLMGGVALADVPRVAVDIAPVQALVARVMDGMGTPDLVIQPGASPHEYSLRPSEAAALQAADLVFWIGPDLTPWLTETLETLSPDAAKTALMDADGTTLLEFRENALFEAHDHGDHDDHGHDDHDAEHGHDDHGHDDHGHDDHADAKHDDDHAGHDHDEDGHEDHAEDAHDHGHEDHGHEDHAAEDHDHAGHAHGAHDPHAWLSPQNAATWLNVIAAQLSAVDPDNAGTYFANAAAGRAEIDTLVADVSAILDPARGGQFIVFHDAYQYFEVAFDFPAAGAISLSDASDPGPAQIAEIQARIADEGIDCVLAEPQFNSGLVATVLDGTAANTGITDPLGSGLEVGPALYPALISDLANALAACMAPSN